MSWDEIDDVVAYSCSGQRMVGVFVTDVDGLRRRLSWWKRQALNANLRLGCAPVNIPLAVLSMSADDLVDVIGEAMLRRRAAARSAAGGGGSPGR